MSITKTSVRRQRIIKRIFQVVVTILTVSFALFPIVWIISSSLDPRNILSTEIIPADITLDNYIQLFTDPIQPYLRWMVNSLVVSIITAIISVFITAFAAYAFSRFRFRARDGLLNSVFLMQVFPTTVMFIALFLFLKEFGNVVSWLGLNSLGGLIFIYLGGAMGINVWLMKGFLDSVPRELDEAAKVDGATDWQIFWRIILPLTTPIIAIVGLLSFIGTYSEYLLARTMLQDTAKFTLAVGMTAAASKQYSQNWGTYSAGAIIAAIPIVILYLYLQDYIVSGLTEGSVKG